MLYDVLSQWASNLPEVKDLDLCNLLNKRGLDESQSHTIVRCIFEVKNTTARHENFELH